MTDSHGRSAIVEWMRQTGTADRHPLALDLRLDATIQIPAAVAGEAERAALALVRLSAYPNVRPAWRSYHMRFYERFGLGAMVPLLEVVDPDCGIGWPDGYPGTGMTETPTPHAARNDALLAIAQAAALDARREVVIDEHLIDTLHIGGDQPRLPPHVELAVRVHAADPVALDRGDFLLEVTSVARSAGPLCGRFLRVTRPVRPPAGRLVLLGAGSGGMPMTVVPCRRAPGLPGCRFRRGPFVERERGGRE